jgi:LPXTG-motif cell wall-anchored protein
MKTKHVGRASKLFFGIGLAVSTLGAGAVAAVVTVPTAAFAYPLCAGANCLSVSPPSQATGSSAVVPVEPAASASTNAADGLPFTGADIEQLAGIGAGAIFVGGLLVYRRRRRSSRTLA